MSKLKDYCIYITDGEHGSIPEDREGEFYLLNNNNITEQGIVINENDKRISKQSYEKMHKRTRLEKDDVVIATCGTLGKTQVITDEMPNYEFSRSVGIYKCNKEKLLPYYLHYAFKSPISQKKIENCAKGAIQKHFYIEDMKEFDIEIPDIYIQQRIIDVVKTIDDKIKNNNEINIEIETMARTIYDYWFLQFDFPDESGKPYKSSGGKMIWNEELKREIPKGWRVGTLNQYISVDKGGDWGKDVEEGNYTKEVTCLRGADFPSLTGNSKLEAPVRYILEKNIYKILKHGDLIIEISGGSPTQSTGRICYINNSLLDRFDTNIITSNFCKAISLSSENYMYWFYVQWKKLYDSDVLFKYEGKTTGIKNLLFDMFVRDYNIALPPDKIIIRYNEVVSESFDKIQKNQKENQELASLRDFLLPLLMNGQVTFKES